MKIRDEKSVSIAYATNEESDFIFNGIQEICKIEKETSDGKVWLNKSIKSSIKRKNIVCLKLNGKIAGFLEFIISKKEPYGINYEKEKKNFCWVNNMFVDKKYRGKGFGEEMFNELYKICKKKGINKIMLDVFKVNEPSRRFYEIEGFKNKINIMERWLK
jgi:ribosomal protein S18 acetylase RimI-like enzyme